MYDCKATASIMVSITEAMRVAEEYASCNFTAKIDPSLPFNKDWANFKAALDNISIQVSVTIHKIADDVEILVNSCRETDEHIKSMSETADNLITHVENVSINAEEGNKGISGLYHTINAFSQTTGEVSQKTEQISKLAGESNDLAKQGIDLAQTSEKGMQTITDEAGSLTGIIEDIQAEMAQIGKIVKIITEIANQTNLLALNAAIEAARAGEAGRGFSVVAAEVKSLAGESRQSAETIGEMILSLQKKSQDAFSAAQRAGSAVEAGSSSLKETLDVFNRLANAVDEISEHLSEVSNMSEKQTVAVEEITHNAEQVAGLIDNTSHDATESAALTGETIKLIVGVTNQVEEVKSVSQQLSDDIDKFTV